VFAASVASCLAGTFAGSLGARGITITGENLTAVSHADMGPSEASGRWVIRSIHVRLLLKLPNEQHATARRVHGFFDRDCWLSQTLRGSECVVSSQLEFL
jgi:organic hydroperoxide reductase OsmC/OhrA